jgi:large subunit ribosomal protein L35
MPTKLKTHRGAAKRFKISGNGKIMMKRAGKRHLLTHKSARRKRGYNPPVEAHKANQQALRRLLPYL